tara:strand:+ start:3829 stop:4203 length:375 start_codon:yes stop_codon:yes gene_type:complete
MNLQELRKTYTWERPSVNTSMWRYEDWERYAKKYGKRKKYYYVSMQDTALGHWGKSVNLHNIFNVWCDTLADALQIVLVASKRKEMIDIQISETFPKYNTKEYYIDNVYFHELGSRWTGLPTEE